MKIKYNYVEKYLQIRFKGRIWDLKGMFINLS